MEAAVSETRAFFERPHTHGRGHVAEEDGARWLAANGYRIHERNARTPAGEIDVVAWDGDTLCFVEVKARASAEFGSAIEAVSQRQRRRLTRAAAVYLSEIGFKGPCRFDVLGLDADPERGEWRFTLVRNAFEA